MSNAEDLKLLNKHLANYELKAKKHRSLTANKALKYKYPIRIESVNKNNPKPNCLFELDFFIDKLYIMRAGESVLEKTLRDYKFID